MEELEEKYVHPVVNVEEKIGKVVGRRRPSGRLSVKVSNKETARKNSKGFGGGIYKRGSVYRYKTHEEANQCELQRMVERAIRVN